MPSAECVWYVVDAFRAGKSVEEVFELTRTDEWFLMQVEDPVKDEEEVKALGLSFIDCELMYKLKRKGFFDVCLAKLLSVAEKNLRSHRHRLRVLPVYGRVSTYVAKFAANIAYIYSTYKEECEVNSSGRKKVMTLGGGPNRIGQDIESDYCRVHVALVTREGGYEAVMVSYNPEAVSTGYDTSDRLCFESVTLEDIPEIIRVEQPKSVIVQYDGRIPLRLCCALGEADVPIVGTSLDTIDRVKSREYFQ